MGSSKRQLVSDFEQKYTSVNSSKTHSIRWYRFRLSTHLLLCIIKAVYKSVCNLSWWWLVLQVVDGAGLWVKAATDNSLNQQLLRHLSTHTDTGMIRDEGGCFMPSPMLNTYPTIDGTAIGMPHPGYTESLPPGNWPRPVVCTRMATICWCTL